MHKGRLEAFSDGVIAIIITIMVLEFKRPEGLGLADLLPVAPHVAIYALSFLYIGIYWNNHHHMFHAATGVSGAVLWANMFFLFWLSLVPFVSGWMGENYLAPLPVALYGVVMFMCGASYNILAQILIRREGAGSVLARAVGQDRKGMVSVAAYAIAIAASPFLPLLSLGLYAGIGLLWLVPDPRIEKAMKVS